MNTFEHTLLKLVLALAVLAGLGLLTMMLFTCADIILRVFRMSFTGAYDIVKIAATITIACGLPYTTAVKGQVAVEFFFQRLGQRGRVVADTVIRLVTMALFGVLAWEFVHYGIGLRKSGEVSMTLQLPVFWVPYVMAFSCVVVLLVTLYHLLHPGKALLKP
jgi:TRAP-type C4-dicarboxylate transport system permease small subunit